MKLFLLALLPLALLHSLTVRTSAQQVVFDDPWIQDIEGFELYGNGIIWWRAGISAREFSERGVVSYRAYIQPNRFIGEIGERGDSRFLAGGRLVGALTPASSPISAEKRVVNSFLTGSGAVRDEAYAYYSLGGTLRRKALHLSPSDPDREITQFNPFPPPFGQPISAQGVSLVDAGLVYYWTRSGSTTTLRRTSKSGLGTPETVATFVGQGIKKTLLTDVVNATGSAVGKFLILLTIDGRLYRAPYRANATATLISTGIGDFALRQEQSPSPNPLIDFEHVTRLYAATYSLNTATSSKLLAINANTLTSFIEHDSRSPLLQIGSVACDQDRIFLSLNQIACTSLGCRDLGTGQLWRRYKPAVQTATINPDPAPGVWESIGIPESGRNLRSNHDWLYYIRGNQVKKISTDAPANQLDLRARRIEVVQVVQDMNNTIPLVAGKSTVVRGYADIAIDTNRHFGGVSPPARLTVRRGQLVIGRLAASHQPRLFHGVTLGGLRAYAHQSYLFDVPVDWITEGSLTFTFDLNPNNSVPETGANWRQNNSSEATLACVRKQRPALVMTPMAVQTGTYDPVSAGEDYGHILARAQSLLPVDGFRLFQRSPLYKPVVRARFGLPPWEIVNRHFDMPSDKTLGMVWLTVAHALDRQPPGAGGDRHYVGMVRPDILRPDGPGFNGIAGLANRTLGEMVPDLPGIIDAVVGGIRIPPNAYSNSLIIRMEPGKSDPKDPDWYAPRGGITLAHELGHNYGRFHIKSPASGESMPKGPYDILPYTPGSFGPTNYNDPANILGFDRLTESVVLPHLTGDLMSYDTARWPSRQTYLAIMNAIPNGATPGAPRPQGREATGPRLVVQGTISQDYRAAGLEPIYRLPQGAYDEATATALDAATAAMGDGFPVMLRQIGALGSILSESAIVLNHAHGDGHDEEDVDVNQFIAFVRPLLGTARVAVAVNGVEIGGLSVSPNPPVLTLAPVTADATVVRVAWSATDADDDILTFSVQTSRDAGQSWETLVANSGETSAIFDARRIPGGLDTRFRVLCTDGYHTALATSAPISLPDKPPTCTITGIMDGDRLDYGETRSLRGLAQDLEDGSLADLRWELSGVSRPFSRAFTGEAVRVDGLAPGFYSIRLSATDSSGQSGTAHRSFEVLPFAIPDSVTAPVLDGIDADAAYAASPVVRLPHGDGTHATVTMVHHAGEGALYLCFTGLRYGSNGSSGATAGIQLDRDASGGTTARIGDVGFFVDENGVPFQSEGDGSVMQLKALPQSGFEVAILRTDLGWNAEMCLPDSLLGGWNHRSGFLLSHDRVVGSQPYAIWPPGATAAAPESWARGELGPPRPTPNSIPIADAGPDRTERVGAGYAITLDGSRSYDVDGSPLSYSWRQLSGPALAMVGRATATPSFAPPTLGLPATFRFGLTVNDGIVSSSESEVAITLAAVTPQPATPPPAVRPPQSGRPGYGISLKSPGAAGECALIQSSDDLITWHDLGVGLPNLFGTITYLDSRPAPPSGRRFYRALPCRDQ